MSGNHKLAEALKAAIEALGPDLRRHMKFGMAGKVVRVNDDKFTVDVEVADKTPEGEEPGEPLFLPAVPVNAVVAGDGWGIFALPEEGAEVTVGFKDGDATQPRLDGAEFLQNRTPLGGRAGSITIADKSGQRFTLRPDTGEVVVRAYNLDDETAGTRSQRTGGSRRTEVGADDDVQIGGNASRTVKGNNRITIEDGEHAFISPDHEEYTDYREVPLATPLNPEPLPTWFQHAAITHGSALRKIDGSEDHRVGGDRKARTLGCDYETVGKNKSVIVAGSLQILVANAMVPPSPFALVIGSAPPFINCWGGPYVPGISQPMVNGMSLAVALAMWTAEVAVALSLAGFPIAAAQTALLTALFGSPAIPSMPTLPVLHPRNYQGAV